MKVVKNDCDGGFGISQEAHEWLIKERGYSKDFRGFGDSHADRTDQDLIAVVGALGEEANNRFSELLIVEVPDNITIRILEYDGLEDVVEDGRVW